MNDDAGVIRVFSRPGCHLCEQLVEELLPVVRGRLRIDVVDIDSREDWRLNYDTRIPVVEYAGEVVCEYQLDKAAIARILDDALASPAG